MCQEGQETGGADVSTDRIMVTDNRLESSAEGGANSTQGREKWLLPV